MTDTSQRFLVVRLSSLGDIVHTIPAVAALRSSFPSARIDWVADQRWAPLVELVTVINEAIPLGRWFLKFSLPFEDCGVLAILALWIFRVATARLSSHGFPVHLDVSAETAKQRANLAPLCFIPSA